MSRANHGFRTKDELEAGLWAGISVLLAGLACLTY